MAITIDRPNYDIQVPRTDMTLIQSVPFEIRELDTDSFRKVLRDLDDDEEGRAWPITHDHNTQVVIDGVPYARQVIIRDPYTITFEDGQYAVNIVGSNNNILSKTNKNQVSVNPNNSAGLVNPDLNSVWDALIAEHLNSGSTGEALNNAGGAGNPWSALLSANNTPGTFGYLVQKKLLQFGKWFGLK